MTGPTEAEALFSRAGLPADLTFLLQKYPRTAWRQSAGLDEMTRFWLKRHAFFRELATVLDSGVASLNEEQLDPVSFAQWFLPRLELLLGELEAHHNVEDLHYFPILMAQEPRLKRGFEILDRDHHAIHGLLESNARAGRQFAAALVAGGDGRRFAAGRLRDAITAAPVRPDAAPGRRGGPDRAAADRPAGAGQSPDLSARDCLAQRVAIHGNP